jgi:hypothetical protein
VTTSERVSRLRALVAQLERLASSPARDTLISDARGRVVDLETGRPMSSAWGSADAAGSRERSHHDDTDSDDDRNASRHLASLLQ